MSEYSYEDCINYDKKKNKVIDTLYNRLDDVYELVLSHAERNQLINPWVLLNLIQEIESKYNLYDL